MKTAFCVWNDRIAPLFDVAREICVVESEADHILAQYRLPLDNEVPALKARKLAEMGVETLICGAISRAMESIVRAYGIQLIAFISGDLKAVIGAWQCDRLGTEAFLMPGCRGLHRERSP